MSSSKKSRGAGATAGAQVADVDPVFWEVHVAARLGLAREKISAIREAHLVAGADFRTEGNAVVFTPGGLAKLEGHLLSAAPAEGRVLHAAAAGGPSEGLAVTCRDARPERLRVVVTRATANRRMIYARPADDDRAAPVLVRVRDNTNFHPRLGAFECVRGPDGLLQFTGRLPRALGRW